MTIPSNMSIILDSRSVQDKEGSPAEDESSKLSPCGFGYIGIFASRDCLLLQWQWLMNVSTSRLPHCTDTLILKLSISAKWRLEQVRDRNMSVGKEHGLVKSIQNTQYPQLPQKPTSCVYLITKKLIWSFLHFQQISISWSIVILSLS